MRVAYSYHTFYVVVERDGSLEDKDVVSASVNDDVGQLQASTDGDTDWRRDDQVSDVFVPVSTTLVVLLCQLRLPNRFAAAFWFSVCDNFELLFRSASSDCAIKAILVRLTRGFKAQYSLNLWQTEVWIPSTRMSFRMNSS